MAAVLHKHQELNTFLLQDVLLTDKVVGSGAYSSVEEAKILGAVCAIKRFDGIFQKRSRVSETEFQLVAGTFAEECCLMSTLRHPNIVQFLGICLVPESRLPALVMEHMLTNLHDLLETRPNIPLPLKYSLLYDVAKGISYLHSRSTPLVHRDLSARNVLLNTAMEAKIGDLCAARLMRRLTTTTATKRPSVTMYMPPEVHKYDCRYKKTMDIFSFGIIAIFTLTQQFPTQANRDQHQVTVVNRLEWSREYLQQLYRLFREDNLLVQMIKKCLERTESNRPKIQEVMQLMEGAMAEVCDPECSMDRLELMQTVKERSFAVLDVESKDQATAALKQTMQTKEREHLCEMNAKDAEIQHLKHRLQSQEKASNELVNELMQEIQSHQAQILSQQAEVEQLKARALNARTTQATAESSFTSYSTPAPLHSSFSSGLEPGVCGLKNLGNTCYMNSALQCLSNTEPLTDYFKHPAFKEDINKDNPLGTSGAIAETYNDLLRDLWCGQYSSFSPVQFKKVVDLVAPQFSGGQQNDSQEFLAFLLDVLHEDLNRVKEKPHVDMLIKANGTDEDLAREFWWKHHQRNQSIVVDLFQGQLRSTLECLKCNQVSNTFDPFMFLSLPLPGQHNMFSTTVVVVRCDPTAQMIKYRVDAPWNGTVANVKEEISLLTHIKEEKMVVGNVSNGWFTHFYRDQDSLTTVLNDIYIYEMSMTGHDVIHVSTHHHCDFLPHGVIPAIISVPRKKCTHHHVYKAVQNRCGLKVSVKADNGDMGEEVIRVMIAEKHGTHMYELKKDDTPLDPNSISYLRCEWPTERCCDIPTANAIIEDSSCAVSSVSTHDTTLFKCLHLFTKKKKLGRDDAWFCSNCKSLVKATRKCDIWKLPPVLMIHLTRFTHNRQWKDKKSTMVRFPIKDLDLSKYIQAPDQPEPTYDLFAVINHYGGMTGGHYTACCKNKRTSQWYDYHDSLVSKISEERVLTSAAYVLFYYRHEQEMDLD